MIFTSQERKTMVLKLGDLLIKPIATHLPQLTFNQCQYLTTKQRERIFQWIILHDHLSNVLVPYIKSCLLYSPLNSIEFYKCEQLTNQLLIEFSESSPLKRLKSLTIHQCNQVQDSGIQAITFGQTSLEYIALRKLKMLSNVGLERIRSAFLREIDLRWNEDIQDIAIENLVSNNLNLRMIHLIHCHLLTDKSISVIAQHLSEKLELLNLDGFKSLSNEALARLVDYCPNIRSLTLFGITHIDADGLFTLFIRLRKLTDLRISYTSCFLPQPVSEYIYGIPMTITDLYLSGTQILNSVILTNAIARLQNLKQLTLNGMVSLTDTALENILRVVGNRLKTLELNGYITVGSLTDSCIQSITSHCFSLQNLSLNLLSFTSTLDDLIPLFNSMDRSRQLRTISISSFRNINEQVLWSIVNNCFNLTLIDFSGIRCVDDRLISALNTCTNLTHLNLKGCNQVTDISICELLHTCRFISLVLSGCFRLTDRCILLMASTQPFLEEIYMSGCLRISPAAVRFLQDNTIGRLYVQHRVPNAPPDMLIARNLDTGLYEQIK